MTKKYFFIISSCFIFIGFNSEAKLNIKNDPSLQMRSRNENRWTNLQYILAETTIQIEHFNSELNAYHVIRHDRPKADSLWVIPEELLFSITSIDEKRLKRDPKFILGNVYKVDKDMVLIESLPVLNKLNSSVLADKIKKQK